MMHKSGSYVSVITLFTQTTQWFVLFGVVLPNISIINFDLSHYSVLSYILYCPMVLLLTYVSIDNYGVLAM